MPDGESLGAECGRHEASTIACPPPGAKKYRPKAGAGFCAHREGWRPKESCLQFPIGPLRCGKNVRHP